MQPNLLMAIILPILTSCTDSIEIPIDRQATVARQPGTVGEIELPFGYRRLEAAKASFSEWLRAIPLKADNTVYLFNGQKKPNQKAQYAVLDISVGKKDLQQCADAVMRLRAEYLLSIGKASDIWFSDNNGTRYKAPLNGSRKSFEDYLEKVYSYCGTLSLEKQLHPKTDLNSINPGDVFIKGGSPGHAAIVLDVAVNESGGRIFILANSYMPAQDIHVLINPSNNSLSPWYSIENSVSLELPEWTFNTHHLRTW